MAQSVVYIYDFRLFLIKSINQSFLTQIRVYLRAFSLATARRCIQTESQTMFLNSYRAGQLALLSGAVVGASPVAYMYGQEMKREAEVKSKHAELLEKAPQLPEMKKEVAEELAELNKEKQMLDDELKIMKKTQVQN